MTAGFTRRQRTSRVAVDTRRRRQGRANHANDAVRRGQYASLDVDCLARVRALIHGSASTRTLSVHSVFSLCVLNGQLAIAMFRGLRASWRVANRAPIETPIDVGLGYANGLAVELEGVALLDHLGRLRWVDDCRLHASDFIACIATVVCAIALETLRHTLSLVSTAILSRLTCAG